MWQTSTIWCAIWRSTRKGQDNGFQAFANFQYKRFLFVRTFVFVVFFQKQFEGKNKMLRAPARKWENVWKSWGNIPATSFLFCGENLKVKRRTFYNDKSRTSLTGALFIQPTSLGSEYLVVMRRNLT